MRPAADTSTDSGSTPGSSTVTWSAGGSSMRKQSHCGRKPRRMPANPGTCQRSAKSSWISLWRSSRSRRLPVIYAPPYPLPTTVKAWHAWCDSPQELSRSCSTRGWPLSGTPRGSEHGSAREHGFGKPLRRCIHHLARNARRAVRGREDRSSPLDLLGARCEHAVHRLELRRVDRPFAVVAERERAVGARAQAGVVAEDCVGAVDRLQPERTGRHRDAGHRVVGNGQGDRINPVPLSYLFRADRQHRDAERRRKVAGTEHECLERCAEGCDALGLDEPAYRLDLHLEADAVAQPFGNRAHLLD